MNETIIALNELSAYWAAQLWKASWQGGLTLLLVLLLARVLRKIPAELQCWLWRLALCKLLLAVVFSSPVELRWLAPEKVKSAQILLSAVHEPGANALVRNGKEIAEQSSGSTGHLSLSTDSPAASRMTGPRVSASSWLLAAWLVGATLFLVNLLRHWAIARRITSRLDVVDDERVRQLFADSCEQLRLLRIPGLYTSPDGDSPYVVGVLRPLIVLPDVVLNSCSVEEQRAALTHELAHVKRCDLLWNWLPALSTAVFFFHPMIWLAKRELRLAQEIASDELAVSACGWDVATYAQSIVRLVEKCPQATGHPQLVVSVSESYSQLRRRMIAMQTFAPIGPRRRLLVTTAVILSAVCGVMPWKLTAQEPDIAVGDQARTVKSASATEKSVPNRTPLIKVIAGLRKAEHTVRSLAVEYAVESSNYFTKPGEPLPKKVQGLIQDDAVALLKRSQAVLIAMADGRFRNEISTIRTSRRFDGSQVHRTSVTHATFDGEKSRAVHITISPDGSVHKHGSASDRKSQYSPHPFDLSIHHLSVPISDILETHEGKVIDQKPWEGTTTLVVETNSFTRDDGYTYKRRYWIDTSRNYLVVRRQILQPQNGGKQWAVHHQVDCKQHKEVQPGLWLPMRVEVTNHVVPDEGQPRLIGKVALSVSRWRVNDEPDAGYFHLPDNDRAYSHLPVELVPAENAKRR